MLRKLLHRLFGLTRLDGVYERSVALRGDETAFQSTVRLCGFEVQVARDELRRVPATGPVVVVANHPTGAAEGIALPALLESVRPDVRTLSHSWFSRWPDLARGMILINPAAGPREPTGSAVAVRQATRWVRDGGLLSVYPAGEVARFRWRAMRVTDSPWRPGVARMLRSTGAHVVPIHIEGRNSFLFQVLSMVSPRLGRLLLAREVVSKFGTTLRLRIGEPIAFEDLPGNGSDEELTTYLRQIVERLRPPRGGARRSRSGAPTRVEAMP